MFIETGRAGEISLDPVPARRARFAMQTSDPAAPFPLRRYHVARGGQNAGVFSAAELRAKRASAEFTGGELIWRPGMADWGLIDDVLALDGSLPPPPLPRQKRASRWIWISVAMVGLVVVGAGLWGMFRLRSFFERVIATSAGPSQTEGPRGAASRFFAPTPDGMDLAGPIKWPSTSRTAMDERESEKDFRVRHYLNAYLKHARRDNPADADAHASSRRVT